MVITEHHCTYFVVFTTKDIVVEYIGFDKDCWKKNGTKFHSIFQDIRTTIFARYHTNFHLPDI